MNFNDIPMTCDQCGLQIYATEARFLTCEEDESEKPFWRHLNIDVCLSRLRFSRKMLLQDQEKMLKENTELKEDIKVLAARCAELDEQEKEDKRAIEQQFESAKAANLSSLRRDMRP